MDVRFRSLLRRSRQCGILRPLCPIQNTVNKQVRIRRLTPYVAQQRLRFEAGSAGARRLVEPLRGFPHGDHDDGPDALEMAVRLAAELLRSAESEDDVPTIIVPGHTAAPFLQIVRTCSRMRLMRLRRPR